MKRSQSSLRAFISEANQVDPAECAVLSSRGTRKSKTKVFTHSYEFWMGSISTGNGENQAFFQGSWKHQKSYSTYNHLK